jgi:hypothetical protein
MNKMNLKNNIYYLFLLIFCLCIFDVFLNSYIILKTNYQERMLKYGGYCDYHGYGFAKYINEKYKLNFNISTKNFNDYPPVEGYFYDIKKNNNNNYLILINYNEVSLASLVKDKKFKTLEKKDNCYFIKFND